MPNVTITLADEPGGLTFNGKTDDPTSPSGANIVAEHIASNFQAIYTEAIKSFLAKCEADAAESSSIEPALIGAGVESSLAANDAYPVLDASAAHKGDDAECEVCQ